MTEAGGLYHSLAAMGFKELALAFLALGCYALIFNGSLGVNARLVFAALALLAGGAFAALIEPWTYGVIMMAIGAGALGVFAGVVWGLSAALGLTQDPIVTPVSGFFDSTFVDPTVRPRQRQAQDRAHSH